MLIADDFISELYEHMGFHPPWKYKVVWELVFEEGRLLKAVDCSQRMAEVRDRLLSRAEDHSESEDQTDALYAWIQRSFDRTYEL